MTPGARRVLSGNEAQAYAARLARVQVVSAYPITPQTTIVEALADFVADGSLAAKFLPMESEHSALQAAVSASALGARSYTATSGQGLLLMHELLHWASGLRAPIVMGVVDRAIAPPWSIGADHSDTIAQRDTGWLQFYAESNQEVLDTVLLAFRVAEDPAVRLPVMVAEDAFYLSHTVEPVELPDPAQVDRFLPPRDARGVLRPGTTGRLGSFTGPVEYVGFRHEIAAAMARVPTVLAAAEREYAEIVGRVPLGSLPTYRTDDADAVLLTVGTASTTARQVVDELRAEGHRVGLARLRVLRPFPAAELRQLADAVGRIGVVDRGFTFGEAGPVATEVRAALSAHPSHPAVPSFLAGVGGRDVTPALLRRVFTAVEGGGGPGPSWIDLEADAGGVVHG